jgi:hypothetical protein
MKSNRKTTKQKQSDPDVMKKTDKKRPTRCRLSQLNDSEKRK